MPAWSRTAGSTDRPSAGPRLMSVSSAVNARSASRIRPSLDRMNADLCTGRTAWTRITPISFSLNSIAARPKNPTAASSKNRNSAVISRRFFISLPSFPMHAAGLVWIASRELISEAIGSPSSESTPGTVRRVSAESTSGTVRGVPAESASGTVRSVSSDSTLKIA